MPWEYRTLKQWHLISEHLIETRFYCKIHQVSKNPIFIIINAKSHKFHKIPLRELFKYKAIVLHKTKKSIFVDIGYHFYWEFGSFVKQILKSSFENKDEFNKIELGDIFKIYFHGYNKMNQIILGSLNYDSDWETGKLDKYIGTIQDVLMRKDENGRKQYFVKGKYKTAIPLTKQYYKRSDKIEAKNITRNLKNGDIIICEILSISSKKRFIAKVFLNAYEFNY